MERKKNTGLNEPSCKKTSLRVFLPGQTQTGLYSHRRWLEAGNIGLGKKRDCTICVVKTKVLISCAADLCLCFGIRKKPVFS